MSEEGWFRPAPLSSPDRFFSNLPTVPTESLCFFSIFSHNQNPRNTFKTTFLPLCVDF